MLELHKLRRGKTNLLLERFYNAAECISDTFLSSLSGEQDLRRTIVYNHHLHDSYFISLIIFVVLKKKMRLSRDQALYLQSIRPANYEIGGTVILDSNMNATGFRLAKGDVCRDANGKLLKDKICSVFHEIGDCTFHTHPRAVRPSSSDLRVAIHVGNRCNFIVSEKGLWFYAASSALKKRYAAMTDTQRRREIKRFRFLGHLCQDDTQNENVDEMLQWMREVGFKTKYVSFASLPPTIQF